MSALGADTRPVESQAGEGLSDRAPDWVAHGTPEPLRGELRRALGPSGAATRALDLVRYASDASPYRTIPRAVAIPRDLADVRAVLALARRQRTPIVFRAGGTSLNGQAQGDGILMDVRRHFQDARVEQQGARVRAQPGVLLGRLNRMLVRHGRRVGPDPASTDIACVGGVVANNSGGMRCGVHADSYSTVSAITFVLADGTVIDTAAPGAGEAFAAAAPELAAGLEQIRDELRADDELRARVVHKFEIKNTTGYRLCAFLDADEPLEIFRRLLIGSEGTLAFLAEAVFETIPLRAPHDAVAGALRGHRRRRGGRPGAGGGRRERHRADGRPDADRGRLEHAGHPRGVEGAAPGLRRAAGRVPRRPRPANSTSPRRRRCRSWPAAGCWRHPASPASGPRWRCCGTSARGCRACSRRCGPPACS